MKKFTVKNQEKGQTLEKYVRKMLPNVSLSTIYKLFRKKDVKVNGKWKDLKYIISDGEEVSIYIKDEYLEDTINDKKINKNDFIKQYIIYEDENIIIINKPRGLLVQKDNTHSKSLDVMVLEYLYSKDEYDPTIDFGFTPGPAHRLDRNTSGIVIFGKNIETLQILFEMLKERKEITKKYVALVKGEILEGGEVKAPLKKDFKTGNVIVDSIKDGAKSAITRYEILKNYSNYTLLQLELITGRTHQIRVHMQYINHPIIGDARYGDFKENELFEQYYHFKNQFLHAEKVTFNINEGPLKYLNNQTFIADYPEEYQKLLKALS